MKLYMVLAVKNFVTLIVKTFYIDVNEFQNQIAETKSNDKDVWDWDKSKNKEKDKKFYEIVTRQPYISTIIAGFIIGLILFFITGGSGDTPDVSHGGNRGIIKTVIGYISSFLFSDHSEVEKLNDLQDVRTMKRPTLDERLGNLDVDAMRAQAPSNPKPPPSTTPPSSSCS
jgi:hypothetical protein